MLPDRNTELENFKTKIDLRDYAISVGFQYVRRQSSPHSSVLKHPNGDKIVVARMPWRHYVYFNVHSGGRHDSGSIIDFVSVRDRCSIGEVRKTLRSWNGSFSYADRTEAPLLPTLKPSSQNAALVFAAWTRAEKIVGGKNYLVQDRAIPFSIVSDPIFEGRIRADQRSNVLFAHHNRSGVCGYEVKNRGFTGFSPGGTKGLFYSQPQDSDQEMVICETAIDLLSVAAIEGTENRRFFSMAGQPSPHQIELLQSASTKMNGKPNVLLAMDNDEAGIRMAKLLRSALAETCQKISEHYPPGAGQDWNDVLCQSRDSVSPHGRIDRSP